MKQVVLFMCGAPVTGKTTSTNMLTDYFKQVGVSVDVISKPPRANYTQAMDYMGLALYKWYNEEKSEVAIVDGPGLTVFDRQEILKSFGDCNIPVIAIWHSRSHLFMYEHNKDANHTRWAERAILSQANLDQQPIRAEGFKSVYHVGGKSYLNVAAVIRAINESCETEYPIPDTAPDTAEESNATALSQVTEASDSVEPADSDTANA